MFQQVIFHELPLSYCLFAFPGSCSPLSLGRAGNCFPHQLRVEKQSQKRL